MTMVDKYLVLAPKVMDYTCFSVYYLEIDQFRDWVIGRPQKIRLKISQEWSFQ